MAQAESIFVTNTADPTTRGTWRKSFLGSN